MQKINKSNIKKFEEIPLVLLVLDGFGLADSDRVGNAITPDTAPYIFSLMDNYPTSNLNATGEAVGLFPGQKGNSEAGHMCIGAGRIVKQDLVDVSEAIEDGTFFKNEAFKQGLAHVKKNNSSAHVMGLLTDGNSAHAYPDHIYAMLEYLRRKKVKKVYLHLFTDGRDTPPHFAAELLSNLRAHMRGCEKIASVMGRFYAMDRAKHWDRTQLAYDLLTSGKGVRTASSAEEALSIAYDRDLTDEYIEPTVIMEDGESVARIEDGDAIFFVNARSDRARQITKTFVQSNFTELNPNSFERGVVLEDICFVAMTDFGPDLPDIHTAFPSPDIEDTLPVVIGLDGRQLYISELEKYAHVTYFFNGGYSELVAGENRVKILSENIASYADKPEMNSVEMTKQIVDYFNSDKFIFICANYPNADMVGHTGDFEAAKKAVSIIDGEVRTIVDTVIAKGGRVIITADHGNAEEMIDIDTGGMETEHTANMVPFILVSDIDKGLKLKHGLLSDIAPTILDLYHIRKPNDMTGSSLIKK
jgi:2,3-bisphosphoglycerate-independent phosphoglycerate mutase